MKKVFKISLALNFFFHKKKFKLCNVQVIYKNPKFEVFNYVKKGKKIYKKIQFTIKNLN